MEVLWIGGSVCSGKSTITRHLVAKSDTVAYDFDEAEQDHLERLGRADRIIERIEDAEERRAAHDERWLSHPPAKMAQRTVRSWTERFPLVIEDLERLSTKRIIVQGAGLFPELVAPQLRDPSRGVWLIATAEFIRWARSRRGMSAPSLTSDPAFASENIIARDCLMADHVRREAERRNLTTITVDGAEPVEKVANRVAKCFGWTQSV